MSGEYKAKITIDAQQASMGATDAARAVGGLTSAASAASSVMRGDLVGAATQARGAFLALSMAIAANPIGAIVTAFAALAVALAGVAWKSHIEDANAHAESMKRVEEATERARKAIESLRSSKLSPEQSLSEATTKREGLDYQLFAESSYSAPAGKAEDARLERVANLKAEIAELDIKIAPAAKDAARSEEDRAEALRKGWADSAALKKRMDERRDEAQSDLQLARSGDTTKAKIEQSKKRITDLGAKSEDALSMGRGEEGDDLKTQALKEQANLIRLQRQLKDEEAEAARKSGEEALRLAKEKANEEKRWADEAKRGADEKKKSAGRGIDDFVTMTAGNFLGGGREEMNLSAFARGDSELGKWSRVKPIKEKDPVDKTSESYLREIAMNTRRGPGGYGE